VTDTPFKVGETYKTRDGSEARLVAELPDRRLVFAVLREGVWMAWTRERDGRAEARFENPGDILPPRRGVWVAVDVETGDPLPHYQTVSERPGPLVPWPTYGDRMGVWRFFVEAEPQP
tara:strand:- start:1718 stop:2071 length:354 start_codon:yes stop_codon:yes gene_type:complete